MPIVPLPLKKGVYKNEDERALVNSDYAVDLINLLLDDSGANFDRPSLQNYLTLTSLNLIGQIYVPSQNRVIVVTADRKIWAIDPSKRIVDVTGVRLPGRGRPTFADDGTNLYIIGGKTPIQWAGVGTTTEDVAGNPPQGTHINLLDGYLVINDLDATSRNQTFQWSDPNSPGSWRPNSFASAEGNPDPILSVVVAQRELYLLGTHSLETWTNVGDPTTPFQRTFIFEYGTLSPYSAIVVENSVFFLDSNRRFQRIFGRTPQSFGKPIEAEIQSYSTVSDVVSYHLEYRGKTLIVFLFPTEKKCWCYDLSTDNWSEWRGWEEGEWVRVRLNSLLYVPEWNILFGGDYNSGALWSLSSHLKTDAGGTFKRLRRFSFLDYGSAVKKRSNKIRFRLKRGPETALTGTTDLTDPVIEVRTRSDEGPWADPVQLPLGKTGEMDSFVEMNRNGMGRVRQWEVSMTDPYPFMLISAEENVTGLNR